MQQVRGLKAWALITFPLVFLVAAGSFPIPWAVESSLARARGRLQAQHPEAAVNFIVQSAWLLPLWGGLWEAAGNAAFESGKFTQATQYFQQAEQLGALSLSSRLRLGDAYAAQNDLDAALLVWTQALRTQGPSIEINQRIQNAHARQGDFRAMIGDVEARLELEPENPAVLYQMALLMAVYQPDQSAQFAAQAARIDSNLSAQTRVLQGGLAAALLQDDPSYRSLLVGRTLGSLGVWALAAQAFQNAVEVNPAYAEAWAFLGEARQQLHQDGSIELQRAVELNPKSVFVQALNSLYWERQGKPEQALASLQYAQDLEPDNPVWKVETARILADTGDLAGALASYQAAVQLAPDNPSYLRSLAEFCVEYGYQVQDAGLSAARKAVLLSPDDASNQDVLGQVFLKLGDLTSAKRFLEKAIQLDGNYAQAHLHLGVLYLKQRLIEPAYAHLQNAVSLAGDAPVGEQARRLITQYFP